LFDVGPSSGRVSSRFVNGTDVHPANIRTSNKEQSTRSIQGVTMQSMIRPPKSGLRKRWVNAAGLALLLAMLTSVAAHAQLPTKRVLTPDVAKKIAGAAEVEALRRGSTVVIVVVDDGGYPLVLHRLDDTQVASVDVGIGKARTAAIFRRPSRVFEDQIRNGRVAALALVGATPLQGGVPIEYEGKVIGAIGVSGNTPQEDEEIALAGAAVAQAAIADRAK
jgi:glc operon protein GlcG